MPLVSCVIFLECANYLPQICSNCKHIKIADISFDNEKNDELIGFDSKPLNLLDANEIEFGYYIWPCIISNQCKKLSIITKSGIRNITPINTSFFQCLNSDECDVSAITELKLRSIKFNENNKDDIEKELLLLSNKLNNLRKIYIEEITDHCLLWLQYLLPITMKNNIFISFDMTSLQYWYSGDDKPTIKYIKQYFETRNNCNLIRYIQCIKVQIDTAKQLELFDHLVSKKQCQSNLKALYIEVIGSKRDSFANFLKKYFNRTSNSSSNNNDINANSQNINKVNYNFESLGMIYARPTEFVTYANIIDMLSISNNNVLLTTIIADVYLSDCMGNDDDIDYTYLKTILDLIHSKLMKKLPVFVKLHFQHARGSKTERRLNETQFNNYNNLLFLPLFAKYKENGFDNPKYNQFCHINHSCQFAFKYKAYGGIDLTIVNCDL